MKHLIQRDSKAWQLQTWVSFGLATALCAIGLLNLPGHDLDRAFLVMGYLFCLSSAFVLSKFVRDAEASQRNATQADSPMFRWVVWGAFAAAMGLSAWGLLRMQINPNFKMFLGVSWLFLISSALTLAKMLRDRQEADVLEASLHQSAGATDSKPRESGRRLHVADAA